MRRLHGGLLAAALLLATGCGSGERADDAAPGAEAPAIRTPTLAAASEAIVTSSGDDSALTVLVTSPDGVTSPGLDAAVTVLLERAAFEVVVVVPSTVRAPATGEERPTDETMSGFPAHVIDGSVADVVPFAVEQLGLEPDLVVAGIVEEPVVGTDIAPAAATGVLRSGIAHGLAGLVVSAGDHHGVDLAAAGLVLRSMLDLELETVLTPGARLLTVPSCGDGLVRELLGVPASAGAPAPEVVDCVGTDAGAPADDVDAHARGHATLVELGQAIP